MVHYKEAHEIKRLKILFLTSGTRELPSSRVRVLQYLPYFAAEGVKFKVIAYHHTKIDAKAAAFFERYTQSKILKKIWGRGVYYYKRLYTFNSIIQLIGASLFYDIVFIQKALPNKTVVRILKKIFRKKLIFDFDDAIFSFPHHSPITEEAFRKRKENLNYILSQSDEIIAGNSHLLQYALKYNENVSVVPSAIDLSKFNPRGKTKNESFVIGWCGQGPAHFENLKLLREPLEEVGKKYNITLRLIGIMDDQRIRDYFADLRTVKIELVDWVQPSQIPREIERFDVGVMPLVSDEISEGKCGFKALEYMAMGIPTICSPVGVNKDIINHGINGYLAGDSKGWQKSFSMLIENENLRKEISINGRKTVEKRYSLEVTVPKLLSIFERVFSL